MPDIPPYLLIIYGAIFFPAVLYALALISSGEQEQKVRGYWLFATATVVSLALQWLASVFL